MDGGDANQRGGPMEPSMGGPWPANGVFSSPQHANPPPPFTVNDLPKIVVSDVRPPLRHPVPKIPKDKTRVPGEPKPKRRRLPSEYQPVGSDDSFSNHEMSVDKDEVKDDDSGHGQRMYDSDTGSTANSAELSNLDLELKI